MKIEHTPELNIFTQFVEYATNKKSSIYLVDNIYKFSLGGRSGNTINALIVLPFHFQNILFVYSHRKIAKNANRLHDELKHDNPEYYNSCKSGITEFKSIISNELNLIGVHFNCVCVDGVDHADSEVISKINNITKVHGDLKLFII